MKWKGREKEYSKEYYQTHKEKWVRTPEQNERRNKRRRELYWQEGSPEREYSKRYYWENLDGCKERKRNWANDNPDHVRKYKRTYEKKNRHKTRPYSTRYARERSHKDPQYRLRRYLRTRITAALRGVSKFETTMSLLGCSLEEFWLYLESKFEEGMTRDNYGSVWHVDHIIPCAVFDLTKPEHQKRCFHFSNLQPLFAADNIKKGHKIITNQFNLL